MSSRQIFKVPSVVRRAFLAAEDRVGLTVPFLMMRVIFLATTTVVFTCAPCKKVWAKENPATSNSPKSPILSKPDPKVLKGKMVSETSYPDGWKVVGSGPIYGHHGYVELRTRDWYALAIEETVGGGTNKEPVARHIVLDAVSLKGRPRNKSIWYDLVSDCRGPEVPHEMDLRLREQVIFAEVIFKKCTRYSTNILSAWLVDQRKGVIEPLSTQGMRCGNTFLDSGLFTECKFIPKAW